MRTTLLGGLMFLVPVVFIAIILTKAFQLSMAVAKPVDAVIPIESFAGVALVNILAVAVIILVCFLAGLVARTAILGRRVERIDNLMIDAVPTYAIVKAVLSGAADPDNLDTVLKPVLVRFDDYDQIAFERERDQSKATLFLPGSPSAWSGSVVMVEPSRVTDLNLKPHEAMKLLRVLGRGSLNAAGNVQEIRATPA
ncbi:MAG: hypothetical protein AAFR45_05415 [Pseudomonadota bacterium]